MFSRTTIETDLAGIMTDWQRVEVPDKRPSAPAGRVRRIRAILREESGADEREGAYLECTSSDVQGLLSGDEVTVIDDDGPDITYTIEGVRIEGFGRTRLVLTLPERLG